MRNTTESSTVRRALSDTLGFVLIFGIVISTVAVVYVGGFDALTGARDAQRFDNAERAFDVLDGNVEDLTVRGAPSRATELRLADASLGFGPAVSFNVTVYEPGNVSGGPINWYERTMRPVVYRTSDGNELVYANGALFRQYGDRAVMFDEPRISDGNETLIPFVNTYADSGNVSTLDTRRLLVRTEEHGRNVVTFSNVTANLTVTSPRANAWKRHLEDDVGGECVLRADDRVTCRLTGDDVYVQTIDVAVSFT